MDVDTRGIIVLVTGGREFTDYARVAVVLDGTRKRFPLMAIAQGAARGADSLARTWCEKTGTPCISVPAQWNYFGKNAGSQRNHWILDYLRPEFVIAFPGGVGTGHMKSIAARAGVPVYAG